MAKQFLAKAYALDGPEAVTAFYRDWAASYDAEIEENGYATPRRCAEALAGLATDKAAPILDLGCGTGLSGLALRAAGFSVIDGMDVSAEMLAQARARDGIYRTLIETRIGASLPVSPGDYGHVNAAGVISTDHAPASTIDEILAILPVGGCLVFSLNDHALEDPSFPGKVAEVVANGHAGLAFKEYGDHLPGIGLKARVYGLRKQ